MLANLSHRRMLQGLALITAALTLLLLVLALAFGYRFLRAADYPGAITVSDHGRSQLWPSAFWQHNTSYRTSDPFPAVYNWYSRTFALGPEARAQSACITMERAATWLLLERIVTVTVCDSGRGRLIFVQRYMQVRVSRP